MKEILLSEKKRLVALVDDEDYELISSFVWRAIRPSLRSKTFYAINEKMSDYKRSCIYMHRIILSASDDHVEIDHVNRNGLDNRRLNLRICSHSQNLMNTPLRENKTSKYRGVHWDRERDKWMTTIRMNGKTISLGRFDSEEDAAMAFDRAAMARCSEFASLNFP